MRLIGELCCDNNSTKVTCEKLKIMTKNMKRNQSKGENQKTKKSKELTKGIKKKKRDDKSKNYNEMQVFKVFLNFKLLV